MTDIFEAEIIGGTIDQNSITIDNIVMCRECFESSRPVQDFHPQFIDGRRRCDGCGRGLRK